MKLQALPLPLAISLLVLWTLPSATPEQPTAAQESQLFNALSARSIGPANMGGRITDVAVVESNPAVMYVAAATGGVWKTIDNGATWQAINDQAGSLCTGAVAVAPSNPNVVWIGCGEGNILRSVSVGDGVYKSMDGGKSFQHMGLKESRHIGRIAVHPHFPDVVFVAALGRAWGPNNERGLFKTTDGGKTWEKVLYVDDSTGVVDVADRPDQSRHDLLLCLYVSPRRHVRLVAAQGVRSQRGTLQKHRRRQILGTLDQRPPSAAAWPQRHLDSPQELEHRLRHHSDRFRRRRPGRSQCQAGYPARRRVPLRR